jgi:hypothetical protein
MADYNAEMLGLRSRLVRLTLAVAGVALAAFHAWLLALQVAAGELTDPWLIVRWLAAGALVASLVAVRRNGESVWGRKGIAIWVLAALLHGPAAGELTINLDSLALPETVTTSVLQLVSSTVLAITLWVLAGILAGRHRSSRSDLAAFVPALSAAGRLAAGVTPQYSPRPPPLRG